MAPPAVEKAFWLRLAEEILGATCSGDWQVAQRLSAGAGRTPGIYTSTLEPVSPGFNLVSDGAGRILKIADQRLSREIRQLLARIPSQEFRVLRRRDRLRAR